MTNTEILMNELEALMKKYDVEFYAVIFNDPDSDRVCQINKGPRIWGVGAMEIMKQQLMEAYLETTEEQ